MALRRYQHKFLQPLEIDQERVASSVNTSITTTNLTATNSNITTETIRKLSTNNFFNSATPDYTPSVEALTIIADPKVSQGAIAHIRNNNVSVNDANVFGGLKFSSSPGADFIIGKSTQLGSGYLQVRRENGTTLASMDGAGNLTVTSAINKLINSSPGAAQTIWYQKLYQLTDIAPDPGSTRYLHIARPTNGSPRISGTVEIFQFGELGGTNAGNGVNYYKSLWMSLDYIGGGAYNTVINNNIEAGGNIATGVTGVTATTSSYEIIYTLNNNWYGTVAVLVSWGANSFNPNNENLQVALNTTATAVF